MTETTHLIFDSVYAKLRNDFFGEANLISPMSPWKTRRMEEYLAIALKDEQQYDNATTYMFANTLQEKRRKRIVDEERHAIDTSVETLRLLNIIIYNIERINTSSISIPGVIAIGRYLRTQGHHVDFVKLDTWISKLHIRNLSSLLSSILLYVFNFEQDELPFLYRKYKDAKSIVSNQIQNVHRTGKTRRTSTIKYSPLSTAGVVMQKVKNSLNNIEE